MSVKIDDLDLIKRTDDSDSHVIKEIRAVRSISLDDRRSIVELKIPGAEGSLLQDLGRIPVRIRFLGDIQGEDAKTTIENLRTKFRSRKPLPFSSDLTGVAEITQILIDDIQIDESIGSSNHFTYTLTLREYIDPKEEEEEEPPSQDDDAADAVNDETDDATSTVNYITGKIVDKDGKPEPNVKVIIKDDQGNEFNTETNDEGVYRKDDLEPGFYTVQTDAPGYDQVEHVQIQKSSGGGGGGEEGGGEEGGGEEGGGQEESGGAEEGESGGEEAGDGQEGGGDESSGDGGAEDEG